MVSLRGRCIRGLICHRAGLVQSKVRILVGKLELTDSIALARPYVKGINLVHYCEAEDQVREVANGARPANVRVENLDLAKTALKGQADDAKLQDSEGVVDVKEGPDEKPVFTTNFYIGLDIEHSDAILVAFAVFILD